MLSRLRDRVRRAYVRHLERSIRTPPTHVAIIQDGNRRYARARGAEHSDGHRQGARTTAKVLGWCREYGIEELTLYAFSTENFDRPRAEREAIFDLIEEKLLEFADSNVVHDNEVTIRAIGDVFRLPPRVRSAIEYAETRTAGYDGYVLNVAMAYGGRATLLSAARDVLEAVDEGAIDPEEIDLDTVADRLYDRPVGDVDMIIRTGGDHRTSNFLPWQANGNEAAAFFCAPYWPEFSKVDFLRALRTYQHREESWRRDRNWRALTLLRELGELELEEAREHVVRYRDVHNGGSGDPIDVTVRPRDDDRTTTRFTDD